MLFTLLTGNIIFGNEILWVLNYFHLVYLIKSLIISTTILLLQGYVKILKNINTHRLCFIMEVKTGRGCWIIIWGSVNSLMPPGL